MQEPGCRGSRRRNTDMGQKTRHNQPTPPTHTAAAWSNAPLWKQVHMQGMQASVLIPTQRCSKATCSPADATVHACRSPCKGYGYISRKPAMMPPFGLVSCFPCLCAQEGQGPMGPQYQCTTYRRLTSRAGGGGRCRARGARSRRRSFSRPALHQDGGDFVIDAQSTVDHAAQPHTQ
jgi:hypothetical protein